MKKQYRSEIPADESDEKLSEVEESDEIRGYVAYETRTHWGLPLYKSYESSISDENDRFYEMDEAGVIHPLGYGVEITPQGDIFGSYRDLLKFDRACNVTGTRSREITTIEAHHLVPTDLLERVGISSKEGICVAVDSYDHARELEGLTNNLNNHEYTSVDEMKEAHSKAYSSEGLPEWGKRASDFIEQHRETVEQNLQSPVESTSFEEIETSGIETEAEAPEGTSED